MLSTLIPLSLNLKSVTICSYFFPWSFDHSKKFFDKLWKKVHHNKSFSSTKIASILKSFFAFVPLKSPNYKKTKILCEANPWPLGLSLNVVLNLIWIICHSQVLIIKGERHNFTKTNYEKPISLMITYSPKLYTIINTNSILNKQQVNVFPREVSN